jgi:hypothetical protein
MEGRICRKCKKFTPLEGLKKGVRSKYGRQRICLPCYRIENANCSRKQNKQRSIRLRENRIDREARREASIQAEIAYYEEQERKIEQAGLGFIPNAGVCDMILKGI